MRLDAVAPRTLLLATVAGWALLAWLLALAGMGRALPSAEGGAIAPPPVPPLPATAAPALGPLVQYGDTATRPLFAADRRPHPFFIDDANGGTAEQPDFDLVLTSVLITPQASIAIVQKPDGSASFRLRPGEAAEPYPDWRLVSLLPRGAVFEGPGGRKELALRVYDGGAGPGMVPTPAPMDMDTTPPTAQPPPAQPATDASAPDPAQIEAIRRRIEARREQMRQRAQTPPPPATAAPPAVPQPAELIR